MGNAGNCYLHIPHKDWANNRFESENYREIERWAARCAGACDCFFEYGGVGDQVIEDAESPGTYTIVDNAASLTCGTRPASTAATTILIVTWEWNISIDKPVTFCREGIGVIQNNSFIASDVRYVMNSGFSDGSPGGLPTTPEDSGTLVVPLNVAQAVVPYSIAAWQDGASSAFITISTYEYSLCGCECQT